MVRRTRFHDKSPYLRILILRGFRTSEGKAAPDTRAREIPREGEVACQSLVLTPVLGEKPRNRHIRICNTSERQISSGMVLTTVGKEDDITVKQTFRTKSRAQVKSMMVVWRTFDLLMGKTIRDNAKTTYRRIVLAFLQPVAEPPPHSLES